MRVYHWSNHGSNVNINVRRLLNELYVNCYVNVKTGTKTSNGFSSNKGLLLGFCPSPTLFKIYLEQALKRWKQKSGNIGISFNNSTLYTLSFADDQFLMVQDFHNREYRTRKPIKEYNKWKWTYLKQSTCDLIFENEQFIKFFQRHKYLGLHISDSGTLSHVIKERNYQGWKAIATLNSILWDQKNPWRNKHLIYNTIIKIIVTYTCN